METFRVWFRDGSMVMLDAESKDDARRIVTEGIESGQYAGSIKRIEQL